MSRAFLSPSRCDARTLTSPLRRALDGVDPAAVRDLWLDGVVEIRGDLDLVEPTGGEELVRLSPRRGFLFTDDDPADVAERLRAGGVLAYDATGALSGMAVASEQVMRRLTDLELVDLPTAGPFAHVTAVVRRGTDGSYLVYVQQELGHYAAEAVVDALAGLDMSRGLSRGLTSRERGTSEAGSNEAGTWLKPGTSREPDTASGQPDIEEHA